MRLVGGVGKAGPPRVYRKRWVREANACAAESGAEPPENALGDWWRHARLRPDLAPRLSLRPRGLGFCL
ncbi:hypothetical protein NDU88_000031 [Pleurodeles waltl]|uniref:Uncharacterized protein n=1 Tax=Pleurodeles waltl TaxID=8319 RepID=A0AAV7LX14_PLEWA|nr:hypothetical protein NDU88_000031 [Pleurodeles waltl]